MSKDPDNEDDDETLFRLMLPSQADRALAQAAWSVLYTRYNDRLLRYAGQHFRRRLGGDSGVRDLVQDVWLKVYEAADTYTALPGSADCEGSSVVDRELWTLGWLKSIIRSTCFDSGRMDQRAAVPARGTGSAHKVKVQKNQSLSISDGDEDEADSDQKRKVRSLINKLSERERDIVYASLLHYWIDETECRIPPEELKFVCLRWQITADNVRQIRRRVLRRIETILSGASLNLATVRAG